MSENVSTVKKITPFQNKAVVCEMNQITSQFLKTKQNVKIQTIKYEKKVDKLLIIASDINSNIILFL